MPPMRPPPSGPQGRDPLEAIRQLLQGLAGRGGAGSFAGIGDDAGKQIRAAADAVTTLGDRSKLAARELEGLQKAAAAFKRGLSGAGQGGAGSGVAAGAGGAGGGAGGGGGAFGLGVAPGPALAIFAGLKLLSSALGGLASIVGAGIDVAKQMVPLRQQLVSMAGYRAAEGLGDHVRKYGYDPLEIARLRAGVVRAVGAGEEEETGRNSRIGRLEEAVIRSERGLGVDQGSTIGLFGAMRRSGETFQRGTEGEASLKAIFTDAFVSGIEQTRLAEYLSGVENLLQSEQAYVAGGIKAEDLSKILGLMGGKDSRGQPLQPGLQGVYGAQTLAQISAGIRTPGGGDAGRSITLMALRRPGQSYTQTQASMEAGAADPENLVRMYRHMRNTFGLPRVGERANPMGEGALLRLSAMWGVPLSKLAGKEYSQSGKIGEGSVIHMLQKLEDRNASAFDRAEAQREIDEAMKSAADKTEEHTRQQAEYTKELLAVGEKWLDIEDSVKAVLKDWIFPVVEAIADFLGANTGKREKEDVKEATRLERRAGRIAESRRDRERSIDDEYQRRLDSARNQQERQQAGDWWRMKMAESNELWARRLEPIRQRTQENPRLLQDQLRRKIGFWKGTFAVWSDDWSLRRAYDSDVSWDEYWGGYQNTGNYSARGLRSQLGAGPADVSRPPAPTPREKRAPERSALTINHNVTLRYPDGGRDVVSRVNQTVR